jgi:hypothetical protein
MQIGRLQCNLAIGVLLLVACVQTERMKIVVLSNVMVEEAMSVEQCSWLDTAFNGLRSISAAN